MASDQWYVGRDGRRLGPYRYAVMRALALSGRLRPSDLVWTAGMTDWQPASAFSGLMSGATGEAGSATEIAVAAPAAADLPARGNYLARHWRGDLSLPVAYWRNGMLLNIALLVALATAYASSLPDSLGARGTGAWMLLVVLGTVTVGIWQAVGIWRSAGRHAARGGSAGWAVVARCVVVLGALRLGAFALQEIPAVRQATVLLAGADPTPASRIHVLNHATEVEVAGGMSFGTAATLGAVLDRTPTIRVVQLNNVGGWITEGTRVARLIAARRLVTFTARECDSACLLAFMAGAERYLGSHARLGFHAASVGGVGGPIARAGNAEFREAFRARGVSADFIDRALATPASGMWYPTTRELTDAHVITAVVDERDYGTTGIAEWQDRARIEHDFAAIPFMAAIGRAEPAAYQTLRETFVAGIQGGTSQSEMVARLRPTIIEQIVPKYLRIGPDGALAAYWRSQLSEARELRAADPMDCVLFLYGTTIPELAARDASHLADRLSRGARSADLERFGALLDATAAGAATVPPKATAQPLLQTAIRATERTTPGSLALLVDPRRGLTQPARLCDATLSFYDAVLALPADQAGPLLRYLAAGS